MKETERDADAKKYNKEEITQLLLKRIFPREEYRPQCIAFPTLPEKKGLVDKGSEGHDKGHLMLMQKASF